MLLISRPSDACSGGIWGSPHEQHGSPGTSAEGHKVPPGQDQGKESLPPSHNPRSAAQNERGVAEKRYHLGQHNAMGSQVFFLGGGGGGAPWNICAPPWKLELKKNYYA